MTHTTLFVILVFSQEPIPPRAPLQLGEVLRPVPVLESSLSLLLSRLMYWSFALVFVFFMFCSVYPLCLSRISVGCIMGFTLRAQARIHMYDLDADDKAGCRGKHRLQDRPCLY